MCFWPIKLTVRILTRIRSSDAYIFIANTVLKYHFRNEISSIISFFQPKWIVKMKLLSITRVQIPLVSHPTPFYWPEVDRLIIRTTQLWLSQYQATSPIILPKTITNTTLVRFEHILKRSPSFQRFTLAGKGILKEIKNFFELQDHINFYYKRTQLDVFVHKLWEG